MTLAHLTPANDNTPQPRSPEFDALLLKYDRLIMANCRKATRSEDEAEDLHQDVQLRALRYWHKYTPGPSSGFVEWTRYLMRGILSDRRKKDGRIARRQSKLPYMPAVVTEPAQEHAVDLKKIVSMMYDKEADAVGLLAAGYSGPEVGEIMGMSRANVSLYSIRCRNWLAAANDNNEAVRKAG